MIWKLIYFVYYVITNMIWGIPLCIVFSYLVDGKIPTQILFFLSVLIRQVDFDIWNKLEKKAYTQKKEKE